MVSVASPMHLGHVGPLPDFADTIVGIPPADMRERDDNKFFTSSLPPPAQILYGMNVPAIPERDFLMRYPQGKWSGKTICSTDNDFRHVWGWGGQNPPTPQDMKALIQLSTQYRDLTSHIPDADIAMVEAAHSGPVNPDPYRSGGSRFAGRESARLIDIPHRNAVFQRVTGMPGSGYLQQKVDALAIHSERVADNLAALKAADSVVFGPLHHTLLTHFARAS
jgi:hypothetical protein